MAINNSNQINQPDLKGKVENFTGKIATILTADGQKINWPIKNLPDDCQIGTAVRLVLKTNESDEEDRGQTAKTILNEILKTNKNEE
ncbi:MAG: hypothetical protein A2729_05650 [Candidatus Buchananbacteria bacterium RIFCSPHIGHO2_01_FULL_39_14]|uniref:DUF3006 domain-containing protein n=2 Tax=Candidatus Buchananiibacteriota TaxID=1817903 RepID=A0A1G1YSH0_9BACT|nr:MAG: hypothetical protein A2729_05650 [Candidatus Buchananbacteria bacterium RIFCSPHIGHO2_01_FULL_39_14]OGY48452.1 MAG: hypothetical protein A3D39_02465 [Candidatus Buchananbacteria bacterium RIFCSPHIGHO2_02_FULL_39_17]OGY55308.1 MAG: hypothetical protein A2912_02620 [Candidatus Buchananbacteria bacterium RIFCSPLOWO2_01_FULL_40_23b]